MIPDFIFAGFTFQVAIDNVCLNTEDRFDTGIFGCFIKINGTKKIAVIRYSNSRHSIFFSQFYHPVNSAGTIQHTVLCMVMQMNERHLSLPEFI